MIKLLDLLREAKSQANKADYTVYFDVDDTLTNYSERLKTVKVKDKDNGEERLINSKDTVDNEEFWSGAKWLPGSKDLLAFALKNFKRVEILSVLPELSKDNQKSTGKRYWAAPENGKKKWINDNVGDLKANFVGRGKEKADFATKKSILIDDKKKNIDAFEKEGGIGILMNDPKLVMAKLKKLALK